MILIWFALWGFLINQSIINTELKLHVVKSLLCTCSGMEVAVYNSPLKYKDLAQKLILVELVTVVICQVYVSAYINMFFNMVY